MRNMAFRLASPLMFLMFLIKQAERSFSAGISSRPPRCRRRNSKSDQTLYERIITRSIVWIILEIFVARHLRKSRWPPRRKRSCSLLVASHLNYAEDLTLTDLSANSGIGFALAAQLLAKSSYHVIVTSRSPEKGRIAMEELHERTLAGSSEYLHLDVTDDATIQNVAEAIGKDHGRLDILVNNAAVSAMNPPLREQMRQAFDTNATGPAVLTAALLPLLQKSTLSPRVVNISSGVGSISRRLDPQNPRYNAKEQHVQYRASKTALNMVTACQFVEYKPLGIKVFAYDPGFTQSNLSVMNTKENGARSAEESVAPLVDVLEGKRDEEAGMFLHNTGRYEW